MLVAAAEPGGLRYDDATTLVAELGRGGETGGTLLNGVNDRIDGTERRSAMQRN